MKKPKPRFPSIFLRVFLQSGKKITFLIEQFYFLSDPCWPQSFDWSNIGYPQSCDCGNQPPSSSTSTITTAENILAAADSTLDKKCKLCKCMEMKTSKSPRVWANNHFCFANKKKDPKFQLIRSGMYNNTFFL